MIIKSFGAKIQIDWSPLKKKSILTVKDLADTIARHFLKKEKLVFVKYEGLFETAANHDKSNLLVDKVYHTLWEISGKYYLLCVSEKASTLVSVDICWIGDACFFSNEKCANSRGCQLLQMLPVSLGGELYLKNELV